MLNWSEKFETGHSWIDAQHRMLIAYVNRLESLSKVTNPSPEDVVMFFQFINFLEDYLVSHFKEEEDCMFHFRCPAHHDNKMAHRDFLDFFKGFKRRLA